MPSDRSLLAALSYRCTLGSQDDCRLSLENGDAPRHQVGELPLAHPPQPPAASF